VPFRSAVPVSSSAEAVLDHIGPGTDIIVPLGNGEPVTLLDAVEAAADRLEGVRVHQMHVLHDRPYLHGVHGDRLRHVSYFLSHLTRQAYHEGGCDLVPNHFSEVPYILRSTTKDPLVLAAASPADRHGHFSLGTNADYVAPLIGKARFFLEVNPQMPRSFGRNQIHCSQVAGWVEADYPLVEAVPPQITETDRRIGDLVAERIPDGATIQAGIGAVPNAVLGLLTDRKDLGLHTELLSDGVIDLVYRGVLTGTRKRLNPNKMVATFALGTKELYDFLDENAAVELWPVNYVNDPRVIAQESDFVSINATLEVDFLGQCASESIGSYYYSSSGGQADFGRGAMYSHGGQSFIVLHSTTRDGTTSRIRPQLAAGAAVTTLKNTVDKVVTEWGVAELRARSVADRTRALIGIAHPDYRDELIGEARRLGFLA
jgi:acyl-CoA hydrolase